MWNRIIGALGSGLWTSSPLLLVSAMEIGVPFARMVFFSHYLDLPELGLASLLATIAATYEQVTEIAMYRFVLSAPRALYVESLCAAHSLSVIRGLIIGVAAVILSVPLAKFFLVGDDWKSFAMLGLIVFIRSLEHLGPRIAERDYAYVVQLKVALFSYSLSIVAMLVFLYVAPNHTALIASLLVQCMSSVMATHWVSAELYRLNFRTPEFISACKFGYPLVVNGFATAVSHQGDRFLVGAMLGLEALGLYTVLLMAMVVPIGMILRILSAVTVAALFNAAHDAGALLGRLKLAARVDPLIAATYGVAVATLTNLLVPLVFGQKFHATRLMVVLLAASAFARIVRFEPGMSILLASARTKRLALASVATTSALVLSYAIMSVWRVSEGAVFGRIGGDILGLATIMWVTRQSFGTAFRDNILALLATASAMTAVCLSVIFTPIGESLWPSLATLFISIACGGIWALAFAPRLLRLSKFQPDQSGVTSPLRRTRRDI